MRWSWSRAGAGWCVLASLILQAWLSASPARAQRATFATYGKDAGLTNLNVTAVVQDRRGTLWVGTQNGVFRANGAIFERQKSFDGADLRLVIAMHVDQAGRLWVVSSRGLAYMEDGKLHLVNGLWFDALYDQNVDLASLPRDPNAIYISKAGRVVRIASRDLGKSWDAEPAFSADLMAKHPELAEITTLEQRADGELWAGCAASICEFAADMRSVQVWNERQGVTPDHWRRLLFTREGSVWARGDHSVIELAPSAQAFRRVEALPSGVHLNVQNPSMVEDLSGQVLLNLSKGIGREEGGRWRILSTGQGLPRDEIDLLFFSRTGLLWLAPSGHGIAQCLGYGNWESWTPADGLSSETVWGMARGRDGKMWLGTERGLDTLVPGASAVHRAPATMDYRRVQSTVVDSRGHVWTGDALGRLTELDPATGAVRTRGGFDHILKLLVDRRQRIWVASRRGIDHLDPADRWSVLHHVDAVSVSVATDISEGPTGTLWFSTERGLFRLEGEQWQRISLPGASAPDKSFVLSAAPDGTLWIETILDSPIVHLKVQGDTAFELGRVPVAIAGSSTITFLEFDHRGWLWVGSDAGVSVFDGRRWVRCTQEDGLLWDDTDSGGFFADPDGSVWIGTSGGLAHLRHPELLFSARAPEMQIAQASLGAITLPTVPARYNLRHPALSIELLNTDYDRPSAIVYRYRLSGLENEWQETTQPQLRFPSLPPGSYTLTVSAYDQRLHMSSVPHTLSFELLPPWWERLWFRVLERLAAVGLLLLVWRGSIRILVARQHELEAQVLERTGELEREKAELLSARANLIEMTRRDGLTGLLNRSAIFERLAEECRTAVRTGADLAVVMADLDHFKHINDTYGHVAGDTVIRKCAERIFNTIRPGDSVGRYGGEELLVLMPGLHPGSAAARMEELRMAVAAEPIVHGELALWMTCSFGVAWLGHPARDTESVVASADAALYRAKEKGRNRVEIDSRSSAPGDHAPVLLGK